MFSGVPLSELEAAMKADYWESLIPWSPLRPPIWTKPDPVWEVWTGQGLSEPTSQARGDVEAVLDPLQHGGIRPGERARQAD